MAISTSKLEALLAQSEPFISRVQEKLLTIATGVFTETSVGAAHAQRLAYARQVMSNPRQAAVAAAPYLAQATNIRGTITMEDEGVRTSVDDPSLESQIATDWNLLAGIDAGN